MNREKIYNDIIINPQEESGVFGIYSNDDLDLVRETFAALFALQHRGQHSCGIAINNKGEFNCHKDLGTVAEILNHQAVNSLGNGKIALAHLSYSHDDESTYSQTRAFAQPLVMRYIKGNLALTHNGSITNFAQLHKSLEQGGAIFQSNSNAELIAYVIANKRAHTMTIEDAVKAAAKELEGAFSLVLSSTNKLIGARDKNGFRPLCIGKLGDSYLLSSESCVFDSLGAEFVRDVKPGEIVTIDEKGLSSLMYADDFEDTSICMFEYVYVARPDSIIDGMPVNVVRKRVGACLAKSYPVEADIVCGVPDSGTTAALEYSRVSGIPFETAIIKNKYIRRSMPNINKSSAEKLLKIKINVLKVAVAGKRVIVIDDSIVKGETAKHIVSLLKSAGAKEVHMRVSSPRLFHNCHFGVDVLNDGRLITSDMSVDDICKVIGADSLGYVNIEDFRDIAKDINIGCCDGCFSGEYKAPIPTESFVDKFSKKIV